jgi:hypothetical protein
VDVAAEEQLVRGVSMQWLELEKTRNASAIAGLFSEDGIIFRENEDPVVGTAAIIAYLDGDYAENPKATVSWTTDRVDVAAKNVVTFQPGKEMEEQVRRFAKAVEVKKKGKKEKSGELNDRNLIAAGVGRPEPVGAGAGHGSPGSAP